MCLTYAAYYVILNFKKGGDGLVTIMIQKRAEDFKAFLQDDAGVWGCGMTSDAAVGDLVRSHAHRFNIAVVAVSKAQVPA